MVYEESFITMKLMWHDKLVLSLNICAHETLTESGLINTIDSGFSKHAVPTREPCYNAALPSFSLRASSDLSLFKHWTPRRQPSHPTSSRTVVTS